jgi:hypothetical protein
MSSILYEVSCLIKEDYIVRFKGIHLTRKDRSSPGGGEKSLHQTNSNIWFDSIRNTQTSCENLL